MPSVSTRPELCRPRCEEIMSAPKPTMLISVLITSAAEVEGRHAATARLAELLMHDFRY